jgi:hypothetical protein
MAFKNTQPIHIHPEDGTGVFAETLGNFPRSTRLVFENLSRTVCWCSSIFSFCGCVFLKENILVVIDFHNSNKSFQRVMEINVFQYMCHIRSSHLQYVV